MKSFNRFFTIYTPLCAKNFHPNQSSTIFCLYNAATRAVAAYESGRGFRLEKLGRQSEWFAVLRSKRPRRSIFAFCASRHKVSLWHVNFSLDKSKMRIIGHHSSHPYWLLKAHITTFFHRLALPSPCNLGLFIRKATEKHPWSFSVLARENKRRCFSLIQIATCKSNNKNLKNLN